MTSKLQTAGHCSSQSACALVASARETQLPREWRGSLSKQSARVARRGGSGTKACRRPAALQMRPQSGRWRAAGGSHVAGHLSSWSWSWWSFCFRKAGGRRADAPSANDLWAGRPVGSAGPACERTGLRQIMPSANCSSLSAKEQAVQALARPPSDTQNSSTNARNELHALAMIMRRRRGMKRRRRRNRKRGV